MPDNKIIVGVADMAVSDNSEVVISTHALGSCIGVTIYDPIAKVGGLLHYMLPFSNTNPQKALENPCMFADTGIPKLFKEAYKFGAKKVNIIVKVAGGAEILQNNKMFDIGKRNFLALRKIFWKNNVLIDRHSVGGAKSRTMYLHIDDGTVFLNSPGEEKRKL